MRGLGDLPGGGGLGVVALPLAVLAGMAAVTLTISLLGARRMLRS